MIVYDNRLNIYDNVFNKDDNQYLYNYVLNISYLYGEKDTPYTPVTGMVTPLKDENILVPLNKICLSKNKNIDTSKMQRACINLFIPNERPYFHADGDVYTCLFYVVDDENLCINEGGETQFLVDEKIVGIFPKCCRLVIFDGTIFHRATTFRTKPRFTIAIKYRKE